MEEKLIDNNYYTGIVDFIYNNRIIIIYKYIYYWACSYNSYYAVKFRNKQITLHIHARSRREANAIIKRALRIIGDEIDAGII